jgi:tetratricopeptide (TPR) repeat protein
MTLNTAFKQVFGETLEKHGFVKVKGRQPYFVRVVGGEILHVITTRNEWCGKRGYKNFSILGGVATIYRRNIDLTCSPRDNINWLSELRSFYSVLHPLDFDDKYFATLGPFSYKIDEDESLYRAMEFGLNESVRLMLPVLDKIISLDDCIQYLRKFESPMLNLPEYDEQNDDFGYDDHNEGLLYIQSNNHDDFIEEFKKILDERIELMKMGRAVRNWTVEEEQKRIEEWRIHTVTDRDEIYNNPELYAKALEELQKRKARNIEALRACGIVI